MSSADSEPHLEDTSSSDSHENNDIDKECKNKNQSKIESQNTVEKKLRNNFYVNKMLFILKEFLIMLVIAITYAAIANDPPKVSKSPAAYRFFSDDSYLTDWYQGEISKAINEARNADIAFVMFYAPWDAECQHARKEFQNLARYMHKQVTFSAVNCWQPGSECKTQYNKVHKWPVLIAYPTHGRGIQYNGPLIMAHMMAFLKKLISPFSRTEYPHLLMSHDAVVVGRVSAEPYSRQYNVFHQVVLRLLERDPLQDIGVSIELESPFLPSATTTLLIYTWNTTLIYEGEWEVEPMFNWILKQLDQITAWISPSGSKSISLSKYLQPGPALILFTPRNPLAKHNDFYSMLREIALEYNYNPKSAMIKLLQVGIKFDRKDKYLDHLRSIEACNLKNVKIRRITPPNLWSNTSCCFDKKYQLRNDKKDDNMLKYFGGIDSLCVRLLQNLDRIHDENYKIVRKSVLYKTSKLSDMADYRSSENLKTAMSLDACNTFQVAQKYQIPAFSSDLYADEVNSSDIEGLKYKTNKTLNFIAMDSLFYYHYAEKLGIDLLKSPNKSAVVILDNKMESHYVMSGAVNDSNVRNFIYNYTKGTLTRALSSLASVKSEKTHSFSNSHLCGFEDAKFCVKELSAENFIDTISQYNKAVIIFYYSKQCSFCNGISYIFLTVAKYLSSIKELQFARVDGDLNLLPWEYTMEIYPTILFIPANQGAESRVFPMDLPLIIPNLISFILANLPPSLRLEAMWTLCIAGKFNLDFTECFSSLRLQVSQIIEKTLQEWRTSTPGTKSLISLKLQYLHAVNTLFLHQSHNVTLAENLFDRLKLIELKPLETNI